MHGGGIFENDAFHWNVGMGDLPPGAAPVAALDAYRRTYPGLPTLEQLTSRGATHFQLVQQAGQMPIFRWFREDGRNVGMLQPAVPSGPVAPGPESKALPARRESDGLLPAQQAPQREGFRWQPYAVVGGTALGLMLLGGFLYTRLSK
jgi:hypothetical protein